ncbi:MAG: hypothetical protein KDA96_00400 [Planctomycetaceae bacterium]|nr:hypothetical protein [Planctomycetaceae bacterium]
MTVEQVDGVAHVKGKAWQAGKPEPEEWNLTVQDPHPADSGSPGLFFYSLADIYVDNVSVSAN